MHNFVLYIKNQSMKKLLLILSIATLAISCKKDKLYNCLEGKWYWNRGVGSDNSINIHDKKMYLPANITYDIKSNGDCYNGSQFIGNITCYSDSSIFVINGYRNYLWR